MEVTLTMDRIITVDETLKPERIGFTNLNVTGEGYSEVRRLVPGSVQHRNYMEYLKICWSKHYGVIISPDIVWNVISNEIATHIKDNAIKYEHLFTTTPGVQQDIIITTDDEVEMPLDSLANALHSRVPTDVELFIPKFSTTGKNASFAFIAAFADAMQVYYKYYTSRCGIPKVKVLGTNEDWVKLCDNLKKLRDMMTGIPSDYFDGLVTLFDTISIVDDVDFWNDMFHIKMCGSGHPDEVKGWIRSLFINLPENGDIDAYPSNVSKVPYTFLDKNIDYELCYGLFSSMVADGYLVPDFGHLINRKDK